VSAPAIRTHIRSGHQSHWSRSALATCGQMRAWCASKAPWQTGMTTGVSASSPRSPEDRGSSCT